MPFQEFFTEQRFTPAMTAEMAGVKPDFVRVWRNRNLIDGFGTQNENGRWAYSLQDVAGFWIAERTNSTNSVAGFRNARVFALGLALNLTGHPSAPRYAVKHLSEDGYIWVELNSLSKLTDLPGFEFEVLDLVKMAHALPPRIAAEFQNYVEPVQE